MLYFIISVAIIAVDFVVKRWSVSELSATDTIAIWENVFHLTYVENRGAAFGMLQNQRYFFVILTLIVLALVVWLMLKERGKSRLFQTALSFILGGAIGNLIDRICYGYVVDLFDFRLINFPVFNVADIFVCTGALLAIIYFLIYDEKKDCE